MTTNNWKNMVQDKMSRRGFLRGLSVMGAGAAVSASLPAAVVAAAAPKNAGAAKILAAQDMTPFTPVEVSSADDIILPEGFNYQVIIKQGDVFTPDGRVFGDNADWTGWYPIDGLEGGASAEEGLLVVNNEYLNAMLVSGYVEGDKTAEQLAMEKAAVGVSVVHLRKADGQWQVVTDSAMARRYDATDPIELTGPVAGSEIVDGATEVVGTMGNCSGGYTPWMTALSCEENYQSYYGEDKNNPGGEYGWIEAGGQDAGQIPEHYGWVVEIDPYSGTAKKRTAMGRMRHENVAIAIGASGKVVAYMGDDSRDEVVYKFITDGVYDAANRDANLNLLETGTLYAANFGSGRWIPVVFEGNEERLSDPTNVGGYTIASQADVLTYTNFAARALGATRTDRPEDIEIHPETGDVYIAFTNNSNHGNFHGQITRIMEAGGDHESLEFGWDIFSVGGPQSGYSSPDNMIFDSANNLWVVTDVSSSSLNGGIYEFMGNNAMFMIPTSGDNAGTAYRFCSGPVECELTGPTFLGSDTMFLSVQHPGEVSESMDALTSHWPEGGDAKPHAGVVAITGPFMS
jgi:secreted PhoX family phosphatase